MKRALLIIVSIFGVIQVYSAQAHSPYYTSVEVLSASGRENVFLKLLNGDGIFIADPMRAVVVDQHGTLFAVSPLSGALTLLCTSVDRQRTCVAYDELSRMIYEPKPELWRNAGALEEDGRPIKYPEYKMTEFGFEQRRATAAEIARAEFKGVIQSGLVTAIAIAWWMLFWLLILPVAKRLLGGKGRPGFVSIVLRLLAAALMVPVTAYCWLLSPYSVFYFAFVLITGAIVAWLMMNMRRMFAP
jgi:hypothetical protein